LRSALCSIRYVLLYPIWDRFVINFLDNKYEELGCDLLCEVVGITTFTTVITMYAFSFCSFPLCWFVGLIQTRFGVAWNSVLVQLWIMPVAKSITYDWRICTESN
jgi:hypothetical protein